MATQAGAVPIQPREGLRRNTLRPWHIGVLGMIAIGPAASVALNYGFVGTFSGAALGLVFIGAIIVQLLMANSLSMVANKYVSAGSMYTYVTKAFGSSTGFLVGWVFVLAYLLFASGGMAVFGGWAESYFETAFHFHVSWIVFMLAAVVFAGTVSYLGVKPSLHTSLVLLTFELVILLVLGIYIIVQGAADRNSIAPFLPSSSPTGWAGVGLGMVYGVLSLVGFETAASFSEEAIEARQSVGRGLFLAVLIPGVFYVLVAYAMTIGYPDFSKFTSDQAPLQTLAQTYWGNAGLVLVVLATLSSIIGFSLGAFNAFVRVLYTLGREGLFPRELSTIHPVHNTPNVAIIWASVLMVVFGIPLGITAGPFNVWGYYGFLISLGLLIIYSMTHLSVMRLFLTEFRTEFHWFKHLALPLLGLAGMLYPLWNVVVPLPPMPYGAFPFVMAGWIVLGIVIMSVLRNRNPHALEAAGSVAE